MADEKFYYAEDPKEAIRLGQIIDDETKSDAVRDKAAQDLLYKVYKLPKAKD